MSENAATPVVPKTEAPVVPTATPASNAAEMVNLSKEAHDQLVRDAARASEAQSRADRYESVLKKNGLIGGGDFKPAMAATPPPPANPPPPPLATPPVGAINANDKPINEEVEAARKLPNTERAIAGMIGAKLRASGGKK